MTRRGHVRRVGRFSAIALVLGISGLPAPIAVAQEPPADSYLASEMVSVASDGSPGNNFACCPSMSADGRFVAFHSGSDNLVPGDTNGAVDVFVRDVQEGTTHRVSVAGDGSQGNFESRAPSISADGRFVAFQSHATNLVPGDTNGALDVFVHDRDADGDGIFDEPGAVATERVSVKDDGGQGQAPNPNNPTGHMPSISGDGSRVAFVSHAEDMAPDDASPAFGVDESDILVRDRVAGATLRVSKDCFPDQPQPQQCSGHNPSISPDGGFVAFGTGEGQLDPGEGSQDGVIVLAAVGSGDTTTVTVSHNGDPLEGDGHPVVSSTNPVVSAGGGAVAFWSDASNLVPGDTNGAPDVFVRDLGTGQTERVNVSSSGEQAPQLSVSDVAAITPDGRSVAFISNAGNLVAGDTNGTYDAFIRDRTAGTTARVLAFDGAQPDRQSGHPGIGAEPGIDLSTDGTLVALRSQASNLLPAQPTLDQVFLAGRPGALVRGTVTDGHPGNDGHANPLEGVKVELRLNGTTVMETATDAAGAYRFNGVPPGGYRVRVTLEDASHDPPAFDVRHEGGDPVWVEVLQTVEPGTEEIIDVIRVSSSEVFADVIATIPAARRDRLDDLANIFYRAQQFASWAEDELGAALASPERPAPVEFVTFSPLPQPGGAQAFYVPSTTTIHMAPVRSDYGVRDTPGDRGPEGSEWHEYTHHLYAANIAPTSCPGDANHKGYANPSTCDSVSEGLAEFLPVVAWMGAAGGAADSLYADFGIDLEVNHRAWWSQQGAGGTRLEREEFSVAALLWDLMDANADPEPTKVRGADDQHHDVTYTDGIEVPLATLWRLIADGNLTTIGDLRPALFAEPSIPDELKAIDVDLDGDGIADVEPLDIPFLMHGFYPVHVDESPPAFHHYDVDIAAVVGAPGSRRNRLVGRTDSFPPAGGQFRTPRNDTEEVPGATLRVSLVDENGGAVEDGTLVITVAYPGLESVREILVKGGEADVYLELPPHFNGALPEGDPLPACDDGLAYPVQVEVHGAFLGAESLETLAFDNCEYAHAVVESDGEFAMEQTFTIPRQPVDLTVNGARKGKKVLARGTMSPPRPGKVVLKLQLRDGRRWKKVGRKSAALVPEGPRSRYLARFKAPDGGRCRLLAIWRGDALTLRGKDTSKVFRC